MHCICISFLRRISSFFTPRKLNCFALKLDFIIIIIVGFVRARREISVDGDVRANNVIRARARSSENTAAAVDRLYARRHHLGRRRNSARLLKINRAPRAVQAKCAISVAIRYNVPNGDLNQTPPPLHTVYAADRVRFDFCFFVIDAVAILRSYFEYKRPFYN